MEQIEPTDVIALRLDDVGACTKRYEVYSEHSWRWRRFHISANWLFLKYIPPFKKWGPYREMRPDEWQAVFRILEGCGAKLTVGVTAAWAEAEDHLVPFPKKFPGEAAVLKEGVQSGLIEIANHGLTHCVLANNAFKPKWFDSNRRYHREFWDWIPPEVQEDHIRQAQEILQDFFRIEVVTFVPPGNRFTDVTVEIAERYGIRYISCQTPRRMHVQMAIVGDEQVLPFHDREIVLSGVPWLCELLSNHADKEFCFVRDLGKLMLASAKPTRRPIVSGAVHRQ